MSAVWIKSRKLLVAVGIIVVGWATIQNESVASAEFLTDRIGEGSILQISQRLNPGIDGRIVYFQGGKPVNLAQINAERPYCRFSSAHGSLGQSLSRSPRLVVQFKNVARARWFFNQGIELECMAPRKRASFMESDFNKTLGSYFRIEKHTNSPQPHPWTGDGV